MFSRVEQRIAGHVGVLEKLGLGGVVISLLMALYLGSAHRSAAAPEGLHVMPTPIDALVPLQPWAVLVYGLLYFVIFVPLALVQDRRIVLRGGLAYVSIVLMGLPFWLFYPVFVPRDPVPITDLFTYSLAMIRALDPPTNCFPSMHVAEAYLAALVVRRLDPPLGRGLLLVATGVWWSTLALGQHWFVDGLAGALMAFAVDHLAFDRRPLPPEAFHSGGRRGVVWAAALYVALFLSLTTPWWLGWTEVITALGQGAFP